MSEALSSTPGIALPSPSDSLVLSKILAGHDVQADQLLAVSDDYQRIARHLIGLPWDQRKSAFYAFQCGIPDSGDILTRLWVAGHGLTRLDPREVVARKYPATARDLQLSSTGVRWFWNGWISRGRLAGLAGFEGTGKTRFGLDLARRAYHGLPAPDGQKLEVESGMPSLWICADGHHEELATTAKEMGLPIDALLFNTLPDDPYGGVDLDSEASLRQLEGFLATSRASLVFVDTLTNATSRDLCRQNDVKSLLSPLIEIAQRQDVAIILMLHLSREGQALGRRVKGLTRTLLHLECPDPDNHPGRLRLWVEKSFTVKPPPLGVTMGSDGNTYDTNPPGKTDRSLGVLGRPPEKTNRAVDFLVAELSSGDRKGCDLIAEWERNGGSKGTLFNARQAMVQSGRLVVDDFAKPQVWHLVKCE